MKKWLKKRLAYLPELLYAVSQARQKTAYKMAVHMGYQGSMSQFCKDAAAGLHTEYKEWLVTFTPEYCEAGKTEYNDPPYICGKVKGHTSVEMEVWERPEKFLQTLDRISERDLLRSTRDAQVKI